MAKLKYSCQDGVTFYTGDGPAFYKITDIDVRPDVETIIFTPRENHSYIGYSFSLKNCKKQFPNVKKIQIKGNINVINISNTMFPNVETVYSDNIYYENNRNMLIRRRAGDEAILKNTFCAKSGDSLDLHGVTFIDDFAFDGCMATDFIHTESLVGCGSNAFIGSAIDCTKRFKNGLQILGHIVIGIQDGIEETFIPKDISFIKPNIPFYDVKKVSVNADQLPLFRDIPMETICILDVQDILPHKFRDNLDGIQTNQYEMADNQLYCTVDGVIFTKDKKTLVSYPVLRNGSYYIPEGTETIYNSAFESSNISAITIADSVVDIQSRAFFSCHNLKDIHFGKGVTHYNRFCQTFMMCSSLKEVALPSWVKTICSEMFAGCELESLVLQEGLEEICSCAFDDVVMDEIVIPASVKYIANGNFKNMKTYHFTDRIPHGFLSGLLSCNSEPRDPLSFDELLKTFIITENGEEHIYHLPCYLNYRDADELDVLLSTFSCTVKDDQYYLDYYKKCFNPSLVQDTAIALALITDNDEIKKELKKCGRSIVNRFMRTGEEEKLFKFLQLGLLSDRMLASLEKTARENNMTTIIACILNERNKKQMKKQSNKSKSVSLRV